MKLVNRNDGIGYFWQWDTGQKISIVGSNVGDCALLSVGIGCTALRVDIHEENGARIIAVPDVVLQKAGDLHVYICECTAESMTTHHTQRFPVVARSKPADYVYTPEELKTWEALEERVDVLEQGGANPLLLDANSAATYLNDPTYGDEALEAIKTGRQILVRVPNADGGSYTAIYSPVMLYQVPNNQNKYLYLFFLRDEKQDFSSVLHQQAGTVLLPTYGQLKMLLSQEYNSNPLEA